MEETTITTPHMRFSALATGEGMPILALHGWHDNAASFEPLMPLLEGVRCVAVDQAGHGLSDWRPVGSAYHFVDYVNDVFAITEALGWDKFVLMGHSLGAAVASFAAAALPDRVKALLLIEGTGPLTRPSHENPLMFWAAYRQLRMQARRKRHRHPSLEVIAERRAETGGISVDAARVLAQRGTQQDEHGIFWRNDPRLDARSGIYFSEDQVLAFLMAVEMPTLLIEASRGLLVNRPTTRSRYAAFAQLTKVRLAGNHHLHLEEPQPVADALNTFLHTWVLPE